jgi:hypothetical protein
MPCDLTAISGGDCIDSSGGLLHSYGVSKEYITSATVSGGVITNFVMSSAGKWEKFEYAGNATSSFVQTGARTGNKIQYDAVATMQFPGFTAAYKTAADAAAACCQMVFIHVLNNGTRWVQGLEIDAAVSGGVSKTKVADTKVTPSMTTGTSAEESNLSFSVTGSSRLLAPSTSLTDAAIEAL